MFDGYKLQKIHTQPEQQKLYLATSLRKGGWRGKALFIQDKQDVTSHQQPAKHGSVLEWKKKQKKTAALRHAELHSREPISLIDSCRSKSSADRQQPHTAAISKPNFAPFPTRLHH